MKAYLADREAAASQVGRGGTTTARRLGNEDYFKSREVYRSDRGSILVDAFRFVEHTIPRSDLSASYAFEHSSSSLWTPAKPFPHKFFFLSHFHSDHYTGIKHYWNSDTIYCSQQTAALVHSELGVSGEFLFPMNMHRSYIFSLQSGACLACVPETPLHPSVQAALRGDFSLLSCAYSGTTHSRDDDLFAVHLVPANHCPGAAILLFTSPLFGTVVHTGDFRFNGSQQRWRQRISAPEQRTYVSVRQLEQEARRATYFSSIVNVPPVPAYEQFIEDNKALREAAEQEAVDVLFLDNTFCGAAYNFPTQWDVTQTVVEALRSLFYRPSSRGGTNTASTSSSSSFSPVMPKASPRPPPQLTTRCAVLIGCYTIGKERVALALRDAFPRASQGENEEPGSRNGESLPWRIYVSPSRFSMLSAMNFFPECFQPLLGPGSKVGNKEGVINAEKPAATAATTAGVTFADVVDTPVQLPVLLHSERARALWRETQAASDSTNEKARQRSDLCEEEQAEVLSQPQPDVRRCLTSEFSTQLSDTADHFSDATQSSTDAPHQHLLSVFLVSMSSVGYQSVGALVREGDNAALSVEGNLRLDLGRYDHVLVVEPTGWCKRCTTRDLSDKITLLKVPYSEHCGFHEMMRFVQFMNPACVVPTVSDDSFKKCEALFVEKAPRLRSRVSNVQPITRFFSKAPLATQDAGNGSCTHDGEKKDEQVKQEPVATYTGRNIFSRGSSVVKHVAANMREGHSMVLHQTTVEAFSPGVTRDAPIAHSSTVADVSTNGVRKRAQAPPQQGNSTATTNGPKGSAVSGTLERLFQRVKVDAGITSGTSAGAATPPREPSPDDADEDCQVVRVVQNVVEISDDDD